ncbi:MAG: NAD(P)H-dependent oxidoreductase subunit E [Planctomycetes bacterium]|nr:NAD(P)H-dependent oxidoreductase subunit E [Planctomycetota bacterium]
MAAPPATDRPSDAELVARWAGEPAPLLPLLHAFHERDGVLTDDAIRRVAAALRIPLAELYGTVTFYHFFEREQPGRARPRVCDGPVCRRRGSAELLAALGHHGAEPMPCAGRCDEPIPVLVGDQQLVGARDGELRDLPTPLPPKLSDDRLPGWRECVFRHIRTEGRAALAGYRATGGYAALFRAIAMAPAEIVDVIAQSGLAGRGGAGFPTGVKWRLVAEAEGGPKSIVCNADEGEPGCFKDRALMDHDPHAVLEGMAIAGRATGAARGIIYLRYEYPHTLRVLEKAIREAERDGLLGERILGSEFSFRIHVRRGAGAYICGEETSLLESLEGRRPWPRNKPPYPVTHGFEGLPTVVNNVETLASVPPILLEGADWYRGLGLGDHAGTKVVSVSGDVQRPGNYEVPIGLPLRTLLQDCAGGALPGRRIVAVTQAGLSGGFLAGADLDVTLDEPALRAKGSFLGAAGLIVFDDSRDMVAVAADGIEFFAHESCGKCFPCRIGTTRLTERLTGSDGPLDLDEWRSEVEDICATMKATSACGLGLAAPLIVESLLRSFPDDVRAHVEGPAIET